MSVPCTICVTTVAPFSEAYFLLVGSLRVVYCGTIKPRTIGDELITCINVHLLMHTSHLPLPVHKQCILWSSLVIESLTFSDACWYGIFSKKGKIIMPRSNSSNHNLVHSGLKQQRSGASAAEVLCFVDNSKCGFSWAVAWNALVARLKCSQDMDYTFSCDVIRVTSISLHGNSRGGWNARGLPRLEDMILSSCLGINKEHLGKPLFNKACLKFSFWLYNHISFQVLVVFLFVQACIYIHIFFMFGTSK